MDAIDVLLHDHRELRDHIERFRSAEDDDARRAAFDELADELAHHTAMEEEVFYPAVTEAEPRTEDEVREGLEEHRVADRLVAEAQAIGPDDGQWEAKVTVLCESVEHHVREEEDELFPKVRGGMTLGQLGMLGNELASFKARFALRQKSVDELREQAAEAGVDGRSTMSKEQLVEALASR
jgi:iron-sulfur cluster repair protein YtfE (RIC family)